MRETIIKQGMSYSPKFATYLKDSSKEITSTYADELKYYLSIMMSIYGDVNTRLLGLKEVWSTEMAFPILNMIGNSAKVLVIVRDPPRYCRIIDCWKGKLFYFVFS